MAALKNHKYLFNFIISYIFTFLVFLLCILFCSSKTFAYADENYYEFYFSYACNDSQPYFGAYEKYYDNVDVPVNWVYVFNPITQNKCIFPYYYSTEYFNYNMRIYHEYKRSNSPIPISDLKRLPVYSNPSQECKNPMYEFTVNVGDTVYYCVVPYNIIYWSYFPMTGNYDCFETNVENFQLYKDDGGLGFANYKQIVTDLLNGKNYSGEPGGSFIVDENGNITDKPPVYDLEIPLNVKCKYFDKTIADIFTYGNAYYKITWCQSDKVDVQGWKTEICVSQKVKYGKYQWSVLTSPHIYESKYHKIDEVDNFLGSYKKKWSDKDLNSDIMEELYNYVENEKGYHPMSTSVQNTNFCIRNKFVDSDGITHYSDYVYLKEDDDGNYTASVISSQQVDENGGITNVDYGTEDSIVDVNNEDYVNTDVSTGITSSGSLSVLKSVFNEVMAFPDFFKTVLDFLPDTIMIVFGAAIVITIGIALVKLVI